MISMRGRLSDADDSISASPETSGRPRRSAVSTAPLPDTDWPPPPPPRDEAAHVEAREEWDREYRAAYLAILQDDLQRAERETPSRPALLRRLRDELSRLEGDSNL